MDALLEYLTAVSSKEPYSKIQLYRQRIRVSRVCALASGNSPVLHDCTTLHDSRSVVEVT